MIFAKKMSLNQLTEMYLHIRK